MIGRIRGKLIEKQPPLLLIECQNGVAFEVEAPMSTFYHLPEINEDIILHTHFVVREDAQLLYGFHDKNERELFRTLIRLNGVGPKLALAILSSLSPSQFAMCVNNSDSASLLKIPGVGKRTAERLVVEMRDRLPDSLATDAFDRSNASASMASVIEEAQSALIALGYKAQEATRMISKVPENIQKIEDIIRHALQERMA
ncbi:MAG: Holliday junction branch migration protein RuvA [Gammaproteobacteria bacterium]